MIYFVPSRSITHCHISDNSSTGTVITQHIAMHNRSISWYFGTSGCDSCQCSAKAIHIQRISVPLFRAWIAADVAESPDVAPSALQSNTRQRSLEIRGAHTWSPVKTVAFSWESWKVSESFDLQDHTKYTACALVLVDITPWSCYSKACPSFESMNNHIELCFWHVVKRCQQAIHTDGLQ